MRNAFQMNKSFHLSYWCIFLIVCVPLLLLGCKEKEELPKAEPIKPVKLYSVQIGQEIFSMSLPGRVRAAQRSELSFKVSGPLEKLPIDEGQLVKKGDLIAQIVQRDFQTTVNEAKARALEADQQFNRYKELYSKRQVSKADFDRFRASREIARAQLADAKNALQDTTLKAPFDGVIAKRYVENFEKVQVKQPIAYLQAIDQLEILIDVPELIMAQFKRRGPVEVIAEFDAAAGVSYPLETKEYSTDADPATQTYQVVLSMAQPKEANIFPGMTAKVTVTASDREQGENEIVIPAIALLNDADNKNYVWVLDQTSMTVKRTLVSIGQLQGTGDVVVNAGLTGGEDIVVSGVRLLQEGMKVRPWENQREGK